MTHGINFASEMHIESWYSVVMLLVSKRRRTQITVTLDPDNAKALRAVGDRLMTNFSDMVDKAIVFYLANQARADIDEVRKAKDALRELKSHVGHD